jgi:hypothetical protein
VGRTLMSHPGQQVSCESTFTDPMMETIYVLKLCDAVQKSSVTTAC